jgi:hypothetical protein
MPRRTMMIDPQHVADASVTIGDFGGYKPNADPHDLEPGESIVQVNAMSWKPGELRVRPGFAVVQFD